MAEDSALGLLATQACGSSGDLYTYHPEEEREEGDHS
jgi:hypothetical protein